MSFAARPRNSLAAHILVLCGIALRMWAAGYVGRRARESELCADYTVVNGPYRLLKHPLYIGNFLLVLGVLIMYNPPLWLRTLYTFLFVVVYALIVVSEMEYMKGTPERSACYRLRNLSGEVSTWVVMAVVYAIFFLLLSLK